MPLSAFAIIDEATFKNAVSIQGSAKDALIQDVINRASVTVETHMGRGVITRGVTTEYHTLRRTDQDLHLMQWPVQQELYLSQWPIQSVTTVKLAETADYPLVYSTTLVFGSEYDMNKARGTLRRLNASWPLGWRRIQVVATLGYPDRASVPEDIKAVVIRLATLLWQEANRGGYGIASLTDAAGTFTRYLPAELSADMQAQLGPYRRWFADETYEMA